jgi:hypothetical protein
MGYRGSFDAITGDFFNNLPIGQLAVDFLSSCFGLAAVGARGGEQLSTIATSVY